MKRSEAPGGMTLKDIVECQALPCHLLASGPGGEWLSLTICLPKMSGLPQSKAITCYSTELPNMQFFPHKKDLGNLLS